MPVFIVIQNVYSINIAHISFIEWHTRKVMQTSPWADKGSLAKVKIWRRLKKLLDSSSTFRSDLAPHHLERISHDP